MFYLLLICVFTAILLDIDIHLMEDMSSVVVIFLLMLAILLLLFDGKKITLDLIFFGS